MSSLGMAVYARLGLALGDRATAWERLQRARELLDRYGAELGDRIVIAGTEALLLAQDGRTREARSIARELARAIRRQSARLSTTISQQRQRRANSRLLRAVLSPQGPIYPRVRLGGPPPGELSSSTS